MTTKKIAHVARRTESGTTPKAAKKTTSKAGATKGMVSTPSLYHRLDMLLHAVRSIAQYEDALCELAHEAKGSDGLSAGAGEALRGILAKIPSDDYVRELDGVSTALGAGKRSGRSAPAKKKVGLKKAAPEKAGRASSK